ncbi:MAG: alpha/beta hydrolase [Parvibaculum sp.]|uniref:alpha/beta hydrolase n=1 Tax=Parvibaculum sp. TaxID=2024848 RepID=UPI003C7288E5
MALDPQAKGLLDAMAANPAPRIMDLPVEQGREMYRGIAATLDVQGVPIGKTEDRTIPGPAGEIPVRIYTPVAAGGDALPVLVYFHGGGWVIGDLETHDALCRSFANEAGCKVVAVDYRLAPEHRFPAAADDSFAAVKWVEANAAEIGVDATRIAVAGDSAGGNLAAVVSQLARDAKGPQIAFQLLIYPVTDTNTDTASYRDNATGYFLERDGMNWFFDHYLGDGDRNDPRIAPLKAASLAGLPRAYVITAGFDPLRDEGRAYADALKAAGVPTEHVNYEGMIHGFFNLRGAFDVARDAVKSAAKALKEALA